MNYIVNQIKTAIEAGLGNKIGYYYIGRPQILPKEVAMRGYISISPLSDETTLVQTQTDQGIYRVEIEVGRDVRNEWNQMPQKVGTTKWLMEIVQNTDTNGSLQTNTIKYILRNNLVQIGKTHIMSITYEDMEVQEQYVKVAKILLEITTLRSLQ
jgi:hypothetical protein